MIKIKSVWFFVIALALSILLGNVAYATEPDFLYSESHDYSVILRGNTESIVYARITLSNNQSSPISEYKFEIPKLNVAELVGYQIVLPQRCAQYDYQGSSSYGTSNPCLEYEDPDYQSGYIPDNAEYEKLSFTKEVDKYKVNLPKPVDVNKSTSFVLVYVGKGYVSKNLGLYKYNFETIKTDNRIKNTTVAIDVDSELYLEGQRAKVNYTNVAETGSINDGAISNSAKSAEMGRAISRIGSDGTITKQAQNMSAGETLSVKGKYATSSWRLHLSKIVISILLAGAVVFAMILLSKKLKQKRKLSSLASAGKSKSAKNQSAVSYNLVYPLFMIVGFATAFVLVAGTIALYKIADYMTYNSDDPMLSLFLGIGGLLFFVLTIFGPSVLVAVNLKNWRAFVFILFWEFAWLITFVAIYQWALKDILNLTPDASPEYYDVNTAQ